MKANISIQRLFSGLAFLLTLTWAFEPVVISLKLDKPAADISYFEDSSNVIALRDGRLTISFDDGKSWKDVKETKDSTVIHISFDPFNMERAVAFTNGEKHFVTNDRGKSFSSFLLKGNKEKNPTINSPPQITYNAKKKELALVEFYSCPDNEIFSDGCDVVHFLTKDGFKSNLNKLSIDSTTCTFAKSSREFDQGSDDTIFCSTDKLNSFGHVVESTLFKSEDFFKSKVEIDHQIAKNGKILNVRVEQTFILVVVQNDKFNKKSKVSLLVSRDAKHFDEADLKMDVAHGVMTFLDSSPLSLFIAVMDFSNAFHQYSLSTIYSSDSSGLKFKKVLERVQGGAVQKVQTIDGVWLANTAEEEKTNNDDKSLLDLLIGGGFNKNIRTKVSLNDGKDWGDLIVNNDDECSSKDGCSLHILTPAERDGEGKFVTGPTPGIVFAVGSKGKHLDRSFKNMNTYISRDGGATWDYTLPEPCLFSFGDLGNIILAVPYYSNSASSADKFYYSLDQGKSWKDQKLETAIFPLTLTTTVDGTSNKFILSGLEDKKSDNFQDLSEILYHFDFSKAFDGRKCGDDDFEEVYARISPESNQPVCVYGHKEKFRRRKQDAKCFVGRLFDDVKVYDTPCDCNEADFECAPGFKLSKKDACVPDKRKIGQICDEQKKKEVSLPDKVLVANNKCSMGSKKMKDFVTTEKFKCSDYIDEHKHKHKGAKHDIITNNFEFEGELETYAYIDEADDYQGENIIVRTRENQAYMSNNGGTGFTKVPIPDEIVAYYTGYISGQIILITRTNTIYISNDGGNSFIRENAPTTPNTQRVRIVSFNKDKSDEFIWYGDEDCEDPFSPNCKLVAYITKDNGKSFKKLISGVKSCDFVTPFLETKVEDNENLIYCSVEDKTESKLRLVSSTNDFRDKKVVFESIVGYALTGHFVVVASVDSEKKSLKAKVTVDGLVFADADFPHDLHVDVQQAYTVLDSSSLAIFMHVTTNNEDGSEFGSILKSNSNGTSYVLSLDKVNRDRLGYVDYDRIDALEGVIITNTVSNPGKEKKKLKTRISHNDGAEWNYLPPPAVDSKGKKYGCTGQSLAKCSLNLHGFTERADYRDTYSSASAVGLMIGVGSVGENLAEYSKSSTFLTRDGGLTWKEVKDGVFMWEYGDRGTILVLVNAVEKTNELLYSLDEGESWHEYIFADKPVKVIDLATVPSDTSRKFTVFAKSDADPKNTVVYSIDFTNVYKRQCQLDLDNPNNDDYEYWTPKHPLIADNCLFGHEAKYLRRAVGHDDCFIGSAPLKEGFKVLRNCSCTRRDFECDYNFFRDTDDTCKLVKGLTPTDRRKEACKKDNAFRYFEPTGYRKIPLSTCVGGKKFDTMSPVACPGREKEFNEFYGRGIGFGRFMLIIGIPLAIFFSATYFVYDRGIRRNGGFKRFGQIRLDEEDDFQPIENNDVDKVVNRIVKGGIYVAAVVIAGAKTIRKIDKAVIDRLAAAIFRRSPGRRNYVHVPDLDEEEELFGNFQDNYEEELEEGTDVPNFQDESAENDLGTYDETETPSGEADSRLFGIDDQSDDDAGSSRND
ncbi:hypothetical protein HYPBUDRAFT_153057 [Hyphopichia burtonii NRRL Y-1933]|uniref:VPS10 domain-containing protein n=1 Tax=Hyphopichia burtonii NRRL Y-1933 TaxID=984485 RepID=A0A1E4RIS6_9ASCO|nr:hypothetical protein HYPBUDRAFT_153057 [Hyphopichia burtonii NRRL Y-1933]ODV67153.1 hypothetical protein HYPBUDRAFT_153057 [Hyphopichia burtonii NRRL Y-1933]